MSKEKHFFEVYSPEYNILKTPGSPSRGSGWKHFEAALENMRLAAKKTFKSPEFLSKLSIAQSTGIGVEVTDLKSNTITTYHAIRAAARALDLDKRYIEHYIYLNQENLFFVPPCLFFLIKKKYRGDTRYTFKLLNTKSENFNLDGARVKVQKLVVN